MDDDERFSRLNAPHHGMARIVLTGGPFDGEEAARVPPDTHAPAQVVWSGWFPWGFDAWLYEWRGETTTGAFVNALIYRPTGRRLHAEEIPPLIADGVDLWADCAATWADAMRSLEVPAELIWPGL